MIVRDTTAASPRFKHLKAVKAGAVLELRRRAKAKHAGFEGFQSDPVRFASEVLGAHLTEDVSRLMESVVQNPVTLAKSSNAVGKTHAAAHLAVWFYRCFGESQVFTCAAPPSETNLELLLWGQINSLVRSHSSLFSTDQTSNLHIEESPKHFLTGVSIPVSGTPAEREAKFSGKHAPHLLFIVDEGDAVPDEVYRGIESCMSGGFARLLVLYNARASQGPIYDKEVSRSGVIVELSALRHPNVVSGIESIPGAVSRETTVRRIHNWSRPLAAGEESPDSGCFELPEFLVGCRAKLDDGSLCEPLSGPWRRITQPALAYMTLGRYPAQAENQLISSEWIESAQKRWLSHVRANGEKGQGVCIAGQDVAEFGVDENINLRRYENGFVSQPERWSGVDTYVSAERASHLHRDHGCDMTFCDGTGVGSGMAAYMERHGCKAESVKVASSPTRKTEMGEFKILRDQLLWSVREWLRTESAMLPPSKGLAEELRSLTYSTDGGKVRVVSKDVLKEVLKRSPNEADALALTFTRAVVKRGMILEEPVREGRYAWMG